MNHTNEKMFSLQVYIVGLETGVISKCILKLLKSECWLYWMIKMD